MEEHSRRNPSCSEHGPIVVRQCVPPIHRNRSCKKHTHQHGCSNCGSAPRPLTASHRSVSVGTTSVPPGGDPLLRIMSVCLVLSAKHTHR